MSPMPGVHRILAPLTRVRLFVKSTRLATPAVSLVFIPSLGVGTTGSGSISERWSNPSIPEPHRG